MAPNVRVAAWCAEPIAWCVGQTFAPIVVGPAEVPEITDLQHAESNLELATISALAHPRAEVLGAVFAALERAADRPLAALYTDIIVASAEDAREYWETIMHPDHKYEFRGFMFEGLAQRFKDLGREEGREDALRRSLLELAVDKFGPLDDASRRAIESARAPVLARWMRRSLRADRLADVLRDD